jgi:endonuclease/exonuclease/phosphatase family metal-dependent hydrolase
LPEILSSLDLVILHLFTAGCSERLNKMKEMLSHCYPEDKLLIAGDYNMRQAEDGDFESLGLSEAWKEAGSDKEKKFTFDSYRNQFNRPSSFRKSHGRCDRVYFRGFTVEDFDLFANERLGENRGHFLSDHYGVRAIFP